MSNIRSVVKVMNFHSLLRVDKSRSAAKKYSDMESILTEMINNIVNNRNIMLDYKTLRVKEGMPELNIYIGSDMGFCSNINSLVKRVMAQSDIESEQIIIGRKIKPSENDKIKLFLTRDEYNEDPKPVLDIIEEGIRSLAYSKISIVYNHYYNASKQELKIKQIFPIVNDNVDYSMYTEDFAFEGEIDTLLIDLVVLYMKYSMEIAAATSYAAENISRQNVTTESLHKIDEREEVKAMETRKAEKEKQFAKVLDNYTKSIGYKK